MDLVHLKNIIMIIVPARATIITIIIGRHLKIIAVKPIRDHSAIIAAIIRILATAAIITHTMVALMIVNTIMCVQCGLSSHLTI